MNETDAFEKDTISHETNLVPVTGHFLSLNQKSAGFVHRQVNSTFFLRSFSSYVEHTFSAHVLRRIFIPIMPNVLREGDASCLHRNVSR